MNSTGNHANSSPMDNEEENLFLLAYELSGTSVFPMALKVAIQLDVLEIIAKSGPQAHLSASEIVSHLPTTNPKVAATLDRIMRLLTSYSILTCKIFTQDDGRVERLYGLAPVCKFFVKNKDGLSLAPMLQVFHDKVLLDLWDHLKETILEGGEPFEKVYGMTAFEYTSTNLAFGNLFNKAMNDHCVITMKKMVEVYKGFESIQCLVDVGGGTGSFLDLIISKYPHIKGINFDLPMVVANAPHYPGVQHIAGDMFVSIPNGDAMLLKWILVHWEDDLCVKFLKNCYKALPKHGKLIVVEHIVPEAIDDSPATRGILLTDVIETVWSSGGRQRTEKEFRALAKQAGFARLNAIYAAHGFWVIEFHKSM